MKNRLKIEFRQKQLFLDNDPLQPVTVDCVSNLPVYTPGNVPSPDWIDMTEFTEGLDDFDLNWKATGDETFTDNTENTVGSNYQKGLSIDFKFKDDAFQYIFDWMMTTACQLLNSVEVRITDNDCIGEDDNPKFYRIFEIKVDNIKYSPNDEPCVLTVPLREADDVIHAFQKTIIEDDWQGWFNKDGTSTKDHPTFSMIVEKKPKFYLSVFVALVYIAGMLSGGILVALNFGKRWIRKTLGFTYFCPSPLIRTYIENICSKFGFTFDTIFDDLPENPYRDLCLFYPVSKTYKNFDDFDSPSTKFIWENRTVLSMAKLLNQLKRVFNAEWYVTPNSQLVFKHKGFFDQATPLYDFTVVGNDKLYGLTYDFNGKKKPAYGDYKYQIDPQDTCSNEIKWRYNDIVDYDGAANNPMLEGHVQKDFDFAMTAFHNDGTSEDFLEEGVKLGRFIAEIAILAGLVTLLFVANPLTAGLTAILCTFGYTQVNGYVNDFFDNAELNGIVRSSSSEINVPRLLHLDRETPMNKSKVTYAASAPTINPYYNIDSVNYYDEHPAHDAPGYFGTTVTRSYNYDMYVDANYFDNLFDRFHEYDNSLKNPLLNQTWEGEVDLCCPWLDRLGVWDGDFIKIGYVLTLEKRGTRLINGRIEGIDVNYKAGRIKLSGTVLK